jgi:hypothetical protein
MAIAVRQTKQIKRAAADSATVTVALDNPIAAGSTLVLMGAAEERLGYDTALLSSVSGGGTWGTATNVRTAGAYTPNAFGAVALNVSAGSPTVTLTMNVATQTTVIGVLLEIEGVPTTGVVDKTLTKTGPTSGGTITFDSTGGLTQADNIVLMCVGGYIGDPTNPSGWTSHMLHNNGTESLLGCIVTSRVVSSTDAITASMVGTGTVGYSGVLYVLKQDVSGGPRYEFNLRTDTFTSADTDLEVFVWRNGSPHTVLAERYTGQAGDATAGLLKITSGVPGTADPADTVIGLVRQTGGTGDTSGIITGSVEV